MSGGKSSFYRLDEVLDGEFRAASDPAAQLAVLRRVASDLNMLNDDESYNEDLDDPIWRRWEERARDFGYSIDHYMYELTNDCIKH